MNTVDNLVAYILENRRNKVFRGWSEKSIREYVLECIANRTMAYSEGDDGKLNGVVVAKKSPNKRLYITELLATSPGVLRQFVIFFTTHFPGYELVAHRRNKWTIYNTNKFIKKVLALT